MRTRSGGCIHTIGRAEENRRQTRTTNGTGIHCAPSSSEDQGRTRNAGIQGVAKTARNRGWTRMRSGDRSCDGNRSCRTTTRSPVAADWPDLLAIVEDRVKPQRDALPQKNSINRDATKYWWRFLAYRRGLHATIADLSQVLAISRYGQNAAFTFLSAESVHSDSIIVFPFDTHAAFCALQSRPHEIWARFFGSSMKDDLRYTPSDCFETFPFPRGWETHPTLAAARGAYHDCRAALMVENGEGMTRTCNRFPDPDESDPRIAELRELHAAMYRAVLDAYGWHDVPTGCDFLLDHEIDEAAWGRKKKPYRYRWPDPTRDEVLARLLALNADRAAAEARTGPDRTKPTPRDPRRWPRPPAAGSPHPPSTPPNTILSKIRLIADLRRFWEHNPPNEPDPRITGARPPNMEEASRMDCKINHLELIQGVINRLASDSFRMKGWCVVLVAALFILIGAGRPDRIRRRRPGPRDRLLGARRLLPVAGAPVPRPLRSRLTTSSTLHPFISRSEKGTRQKNGID